MDAMSMVALAKASRGGGGSGTQMYAHIICFSYYLTTSIYENLSFIIINEQSTNMSVQDVYDYFKAQGFTSVSKMYPAGGVYNHSSSTTQILTNVYVTNTNKQFVSNMDQSNGTYTSTQWSVGKQITIPI